MRLSYLLIFAAILCIVSARKGIFKVATEDDSQWTRQKLNSYLDTYRIPRPGNHHDDNMVYQMVKNYRSAAARNAQLFGAHIDHALTKVSIQLEAMKHIQKENIDGLVDDIRHRLRRLELRNAINKEKVHAELDAVKHRVLQQKWMTEAQWQLMANDLEKALVTDTWYYRFLVGHGIPGPAQESFSRWLEQLDGRLKKNKNLTLKELESTRDTVKAAILNTTQHHQLGDKAWWKQLEAQLKHKVRPQSMQSILESLQDDIHGFKMFAMEYLDDKCDQAHGILHTIKEWLLYVKDRLCSLSTWLLHQLSQPDSHTPAAASASSSYAVAVAQSNSLSSAVHSASLSAQSVVHIAGHAASLSASSLSVEAKKSAHLAKQSFADYWYHTEQKMLRRAGYSDAQLIWIQNYLDQTIKDHTSLAKHHIDHVVHTIRRYLVEAHLQSANDIDRHLARLQSLLEKWRQSLPTLHSR